MMDFTSITVTKEQGFLEIRNPTNYPLIGKGAQGAVFKLSEDRCVKIYPKPTNAEKEKNALMLAQHLPFIPKLYETGENFVIMEFLNGPSLKQYLRERRYLPHFITQQLIDILMGLKSLGLSMIDAPLRHIMVVKNYQLKMIDHADAFETDHIPIPIKLFREMHSLKLLEEFLYQVNQIHPTLYSQWENYLHDIQEEFTRKIHNGRVQNFRLQNAFAFNLLGKKHQNVVFRLTENLCVKIFGEPELALQEAVVLSSNEVLSFIPRMYEAGSNFIIMEYLTGPTLYTFLQKQPQMPEYITGELLANLRKMKSAGFSQVDMPLRNIIITANGLKVFDLANSYTITRSTPLGLLKDLSQLNFLESFLLQVKKLDRETYNEWISSLLH